MQIMIVAVGRARQGAAEDLAALYGKRCSWSIDTVTIAPRTGGSAARRLEEEASRLQQAVPKDAVVCVLDERGMDLSSQAFAAMLDQYRQQGRHRVAFIIGGADGVAESMKKRADRLIAFGRATWPHRLVRAMLTEQIYRASTILSGHPYHRE